MQDLNERFEALVFIMYQIKAQNQQNKHLATTLLRIFAIHLHFKQNFMCFIWDIVIGTPSLLPLYVPIEPFEKFGI